MNLLPGVQRYVGDADLALGIAGKPVRIFSIECISTGTAATLKLFNGTDNTAGNQYGQVDGTISKSVVVNYEGGKLFPNGCFIDTGANNAFTMVTFTHEQ
jgi:hypothetical protein